MTGRTNCDASVGSYMPAPPPKKKGAVGPHLCICEYLKYLQIIIRSWAGQADVPERPLFTHASQPTPPHLTPSFIALKKLKAFVTKRFYEHAVDIKQLSLIPSSVFLMLLQKMKRKKHCTPSSTLLFLHPN